MGQSIKAKSFGEIALGINSSSYTPTSINSYDPSDRLFVLGNGVDNNNLHDAMVILKDGSTTINGNTTINGDNTFLIYI
jgi:hypothetical protein